MKWSGSLAIMAMLTATGASAQGIDLTGRYRCVQLCAPGDQPAFITQSGWNLNLVSEAGRPSRAWIEWGGRIWAESFNEGAIYSPDGMTIQFDRGKVWQRDLGELAPAAPVRPIVARPPSPQRGAAPPSRNTVTAVPAAPAPVRPRVTGVPAGTTAFDGQWSILILTQSGNCDRSYRYGVRISNGDVGIDGGELASMQGRVAPNGSVRVSISSGGQMADGEGRLSRSGSGSGTWHGQGSGGSCAGIWQAELRG
jgi:hypothetical protein